MQLPIISRRHVWFVLSGVLVAAAIAAIALFPPKFGIDFTGGSLMELSFAQEVPASADLQKIFHDAGITHESVVQQVGEKGAIARLPSLDEATHQKALSEVVAAYPGTTELRFESVGPAVGGELRTKALASVALVLVAIAAYIAYAFRKVSGPVSSWAYGVTTLFVALTHDVIIPIGAFAIFAQFVPAELNSAFVAAILTILGFSVHDTIVVFDRIRETLSRRAGNFAEIVNSSVNDTLGRSINTSLTAVFPMIAIFLFGGESLRAFAFVLIVGLVAGTYSSIFLAAPLLVETEKWMKKR